MQEKGSGLILIVIIIVVIAVLGVITWRIMDTGPQSPPRTTETPPATSNQKPRNNEFKASSKAVSFTYPSDWSTDIKVGDSNYPTQTENGFVYDKSGQKYIEFAAGLEGLGGACDHYIPYTVIRADEINAVMTGKKIYYSETIQKLDDGNYLVSFGLTDSSRFIKVGETESCPRDFPNYFNPNDGMGRVRFGGDNSLMGKTFKSYDEAFKFFSEPDYLKAKTIIQSLQYKKN